MAAVDQLLERLKSLDEVVDYVPKAPSGVPKVVLDHALRAVAVQGLSIFEQFLRERGREWSEHLTHARISAANLPGGVVPYSDRIVQTLPKRFRDLDDARRPTLVQELAGTLSSFSNGNLVGHDLFFFFAWSGSNVQTTDVEAIARLVGISKGWGELTAAWKVLDPRFPGNASAESTMKNFAVLRHQIAHQSDAAIDVLAVSSITRNVRLSAMIVDVAVSQALDLTCKGRPVPDGMGRQIKLRRVVRDGTKWPEYPPGSKRAYRRHSTIEIALAEAGARAKAQGEVLLALDGNEIVDWRAVI